MVRQLSIVRHALGCIGCVTLAIGCGSAAPVADAPSAPAEPASAEGASAATGAPSDVSTPAPAPATPAPSAAPEPTPTPTQAAVAPDSQAGPQPAPAEASATDSEQMALAARANGPAKGGPRGPRPCAFHESVDTYQRQCVAKVNPDGSVLVSAKGTQLNPDHGFEFTLHGGDDNVWVAQGTLNAFGLCRGPFVARVSLSIDHGVKLYELRFKEHCMIVIR